MNKEITEPTERAHSQPALAAVSRSGRDTATRGSVVGAGVPVCGSSDNRASRLEDVDLVLRCHNLKLSLHQKLYGEYTNQLIRNIN